MEHDIAKLSERIQELNDEMFRYNIRDEKESGTMWGFFGAGLTFFIVGLWCSGRSEPGSYKTVALGLAVIVFLLCYTFGVIVGCARKSKREKALQQIIVQLKWEKMMLESQLQQQSNAQKDDIHT